MRKRLLKANRHVDEHAAMILLERSTKYENEELIFSRDYGVVKYVIYLRLLITGSQFKLS